MDIGIFYNKTSGYFETQIENGDLKADDGLQTMVLISLFTDQRVTEDELPQGHTSKRGYWGDMFPEVEGDQIGSKLWTFDREKLTLTTITNIERGAENSLAWMIEDNLAKSVAVSASRDEFNRLILSVNITKPDGETNKYGFLWDNQEIRQVT